jgi:hypothetical protein
MGGLSGMPGSCPGTVEEDEVGRITGLFRGGTGGTQGAPGVDSPCPANCWWGNI